MTLRSDARLPSLSPICSMGSGLAPLSSRSTTFSTPWVVGTVTMRSSTLASPKREKSILPSCGLRRSEMSRSDMIFRRATRAGRYSEGSSRYTVKAPSTRKRISTLLCGELASMWMSDALRLMASSIIVLTRRTRVLLDSVMTSLAVSL